MIDLQPCPHCGEVPTLKHTPTPYLGGCYHVKCLNDSCDEKPGTWYYYKSGDAVYEWNEVICNGR